MTRPKLKIVKTLADCTKRTNLRQVTVDFVAIEVGIVRVAVGVVHPYSLVAGVAKDADSMSHDSWLVQSGLPVDQHAVGVIQMSPHLFSQEKARDTPERTGIMSCVLNRCSRTTMPFLRDTSEPRRRAVIVRCSRLQMYQRKKLFQEYNAHSVCPAVLSASHTVKVKHAGTLILARLYLRW